MEPLFGTDGAGWLTVKCFFDCDLRSIEDSVSHVVCYVLGFRDPKFALKKVVSMSDSIA